jgi:exopolysaccharide biosynthesis polyprenyl glycosylphosphotransferase
VGSRRAAGIDQIVAGLWDRDIGPEFWGVVMGAVLDGAIAAEPSFEDAESIDFSFRISSAEQASRRFRSTARSAVAWSSRTWGILDFFLAASSYLLAHALSPQFRFAEASHSTVFIGTVLFSVSLVFFSCVLGVYDRHNFTSISRMAAQQLFVSGFALAITSLAFGWLGYVRVGRFIIVGAFFLSTVLTFACRMLARELAQRSKIRVMFIGPKEKFRRLAVQLRHLHSDFYQRPTYLNLKGECVATRRGKLETAFAEHRPDEVIVLDGSVGVLDVLHHSSSILRSGCGIFSYSAYYEKLLGEVPVDVIDERGVLGGGFQVGSFHSGLVKRPLDMALAAIGMLIGAPLMLFCAALVRLTSPGPIIYKQVRVGRYGRLFWIYKFRTMRVDAEKNGAVWAKKSDGRITPVGKFLRKTRFDELPQLWNILVGDMSLVGPRPERPEFVEQLRRQVPHYDLRHLVQPGLTGWAQVRFRYGSSIADSQRKLAFDLYYVRHCGLMFDAAIWLRTLAAMAKGAR